MSDKKTNHRVSSEIHGEWKALKLFLWNPSNRTILGRTSNSWAKFLLFYFIFYIVLIIFFATMLLEFYQTLNDKVPKWQLEESLIGSNPNLGFKPMPEDGNILIRYNSKDASSYSRWIEQLDLFLEDYEFSKRATNGDERRVSCDYGKPPLPGQICDVKLYNMGPCRPNNNYNYDKSAPCIFLKLNKILGWIPQYYKDNEALPDRMPEQLKTAISKNTIDSARTIWVSCGGKNPADVTNIGQIEYFPRPGFAGYYFPFKNDPGYLSPLVAVWFKNPTPGVLINVECRAWARNIKFNEYEKRGFVRFQLMVD